MKPILIIIALLFAVPAYAIDHADPSNYRITVDGYGKYHLETRTGWLKWETVSPWNALSDWIAWRESFDTKEQVAVFLQKIIEFKKKKAVEKAEEKRLSKRTPVPLPPCFPECGVE